MKARTRKMNHAARALATGALALALAGCSVSLFPEKQAQRQFSLPFHFEADSAAGEAGASMPVLKVARPQGLGVLGGKRIVTEVAPDELAAYGGVRWVTQTPELVRDHLIRALRQDARLGAVVSDTSGSGSEVTLSSALRGFHEDRTGERTRIRLYLQAQLVENGSRKTLATRDFRITVPITGDGIEASVTAFGRAADRLAAEVGDWLTTSLADY